MRSYEFINESTTGKLPRGHAHATKHIIKFRDDGTDRLYNLNQIMKAAAMSDGSSTKSLDMDYESFVGKYNMAYPYTKTEYNMMIQSINTVGDSEAQELVRDHRSMEIPEVHKVSPVKHFKGYGKK